MTVCLAGARRNRRDRDGEQQARDREHDVDDAHDDRVDPAAEGAGERAEDQPADQADHGGEDTDDEGLASADEEARQEVPARPCHRRAGSRAGPAGPGCVWGRTWSSRGCAAGSCGAIHGPKTARTTKSRVMAAPTRKMGLRRSRAHALAMSDWPSPPATRPASATVTVPGGEAAGPAAGKRRCALALPRSGQFWRCPCCSASVGVWSGTGRTVTADHLVLMRGSMTA